MAADNSVCVGCFRTLAEIADWRCLSEAEKMRVIAAARGRRAARPGGQLPTADESPGS